jgi:hypothetical protein
MSESLGFKKDLERIDRIIEEEFEKIDPEKWELKQPG